MWIMKLEYGKKDITAPKAIMLPSLCQCLLWRLHVFAYYKQSPQQAETCEEVDMCAGSVELITVAMVLAHNSFLLIV